MTRSSDAPGRQPRADRRVDSVAETHPGVSAPRASAGRAQVCLLCDRESPVDARFCGGCGHRFGADAFDEDTGAADPLLGRLIADRYRMEELLGRGGMGVVYRVEHVNIGKLMAMKLLHGALARDKDTVKRFKREAELVSRLDHPNTVQVFDFGQSQGMMFLVMEYLPGRDLGQVIKEDGPLPFSRVARVGAQVCGSVGQAHERGVVHRDLKPENIMLIERSVMPDYVKVLDFGLAKLREHEEMEGHSITRQGSILGTPYYMAPEHIRGERVDERSDVYALGALMYKAVTGVPPFWASTPVGVLTMHLTDEPEPPSRRAPDREIPPEADEILMRAMGKDPSNRFQTMRGLRDALLEYLEAVGEDAGLESLGLAGFAVSTESGRQRHVATRGDVDRFEARLRRRSVAGALVALLALAGLAFAAIYAWQQRPAEIATREQEPNDQLVQANPLPEGVELRGYLGRRLDETRSDADLYVIHNPGGERRVIRIDVSAIPNIDLMFELFREGNTTAPLLSADSAGIGQPESVPNFRIDGSTYYLRVRELWESGALPTENVSDPYTVSWRVVARREGDEEEVNDSVELAGRIGVGASARGFIGWGGDEDVYCLDGESSRVFARVEAVPSLDLVLRRIDRMTGRVTEFDERGLGGDERTDTLERAEPGRFCFEVSARRPKIGVGNDADHAYRLHVEREPEGAP